jgi:hypothetical protein
MYGDQGNNKPAIVLQVPKVKLCAEIWKDKSIGIEILRAFENLSDITAPIDIVVLSRRASLSTKTPITAPHIPVAGVAPRGVFMTAQGEWTWWQGQKKFRTAPICMT